MVPVLRAGEVDYYVVALVEPCADAVAVAAAVVSVWYASLRSCAVVAAVVGFDAAFADIFVVALDRQGFVTNLVVRQKLADVGRLELGFRAPGWRILGYGRFLPAADGILHHRAAGCYSRVRCAALVEVHYQGHTAYCYVLSLAYQLVAVRVSLAREVSFAGLVESASAVPVHAAPEVYYYVAAGVQPCL